GNPDYTQVLTPDESLLPVDPADQAPVGYSEDQRGKPGGFVADPDVMDTWATSSLTPQIAGGWEYDNDLWRRVYPMDLRPQAHEIIRTWLFSSVVRAHLEDDGLPWTNVAISGWILDPDRKKMSKSKGNVVTPMGLLDQHGADAVRYWAASGRPGTDTAFDEAQMKVGRRLAIKILNASKFALSFAGDPSAAVTEPLDLSMLAALREVVAQATAAFEDYNYARALELTESF
ncbi:MAG: class I tRNA ligase family protein, partial [Actinobacteria bacterium]|nr:class I tRNA ligase family protein [Actinomycetota bacterium]